MEIDSSVEASEDEEENNLMDISRKAEPHGPDMKADRKAKLSKLMDDDGRYSSQKLTHRC